MSLISAQMKEQIEGGSWIRRMFDAGIQLKRQYGEDAVCDFSLGNPDLPPPASVAKGLRDLAEHAGEPFSMGYTPNGGSEWARNSLAAYLSKEQGIEIKGQDLVLCCGAAAGLNVFFRSVLEPGDQVLSFRPYFVEYGSYVRNHGGVFDTVPSKPDTFQLDLDALEAAITQKTRAIIINSPNNPTGVIYTLEEVKALAALLEKASRKNGRPIFLIADEPYRFLAFDGAKVPSVLPLYDYAVLVSSFSKNLSLPGERVGYVALSPRMEGRAELIAALCVANRILGFVNPPIVGQHLMAAALGTQVDASVYARRRALMADVLKDAGYEFQMPAGAFYFFPKAPGGDDLRFVNEKLMPQLVLAVPGTGFGGPGHFRLAFCVSEDVIERSREGFKKALRS
ncbi:MAG: pyridoxal phosphate-dependent aminotransferase [Desulfovibrionaceae bacterium]|nr:pyridoxal phosphate-dependent aminotransferase [Desulfovibrionaceae bacterium]